jgi:protein phosphatase
MTANSDVIQLAYGFLSDIGHKREANQDSYAVLSRADLRGRLDGLFVVADGMGGARGGEVASRIVVQSLPEAVVGALNPRPGVTGIDPDRILYEAITRANHNVYTRKVENPELRHMGTTCVAAILQEGRLTVGNVGDSRLYLLRQSLLTQLTEDHSEVYEQVKSGRMSRDEARTSKFRNRITRYIGAGAEVVPDVNTLPLEEGDVVLICSDGLTTELKETQIARILATYSHPQQTCEQLVAAALQHGGSDNVTVIVVHYGEFTPLDLPVLAEEADAEPDTDREANWRKQRGERDSTRPHRRQARSSSGWGTAAAAILVSALILSLIVNYLLWNGTLKPGLPEKVAPPPKAPTTPPPITFDERARAMTVYKKQPLLANILQVAPDGNLIAVTASGDILRITPRGEDHNVSSAGYKLFNGPVPTNRTPLRSNRRAVGTVTVTPPSVAIDAQGNRYQLAPGARWIEQLTPDGTSVNASIGKGTLVVPTCLAVMPQTGDLYVIDNHALKRIAAHKPAPHP